MPRQSKFTLLTIRGIPVGVDWSWFFVLFLVIWLLSGFYIPVHFFPPWLQGVANASPGPEEPDGPVRPASAHTPRPASARPAPNPSERNSPSTSSTPITCSETRSSHGRP